MDETIPTEEPTTLVAGVDWAWDVAVDTHPPEDGWALKYALRGPGTLDISVEGGIGVYQVRIPYAQTEDLSAGSYRFIAVLEKDEQRIPFRRGRIHVNPNLFKLEDGRTHAERMLYVIESALEGRVGKGINFFMINGRSVQHIPPEELLKLKIHYEELVRQEQGGKWSQSIPVRFGPVQ